MTTKPAARRGSRQRPRVASGIAVEAGALPAARVDAVDAARGVAIAMMIAYHFCFDLTFYGWAHWPMLDATGWIAWRSAIVASFLFVVGVSLALRDARGASAWLDRGFVRRWLQVAAAAALVTAGSAALFPKTFIYFGVLHSVAVAVWVCRRASRLGVAAIAAGIVVIAVGLVVSDAAFDPRARNWIGFAATKPLTEDYVPLFPWLGVVLLGCGAGALWGRREFRVAPALASAAAAVPLRVRRILVGMGRWSLTIYLVHQPLMLGVLGLFELVVPAKAGT